MAKKFFIVDAVVDALRALEVETITVVRGGKHIKVLWSDRGGKIQGTIVCASTPSDRRAILNNVALARRQVRLARSE